MRVVVAGASGVIGRQVVPMLTAAGHEVVGLARSDARAAEVERAGATVGVADVLDRDAVVRVVRDIAPDAVVHMATAIPHVLDPRRLARQFETTNRLRTEGTRNLVEAVRAAGVHRFVAQGLAYAYDPAGDGRPATEDDPLWMSPPRRFAPVLAALRELERLTARAGGLVLRLGHLYGPGSAYAADGLFVRQIRAGKLPILGRGTAVFSFIHAAEAASAIVAAVERGTTRSTWSTTTQRR